MRLTGLPLELGAYPAETRPNPQFPSGIGAPFERFYLPRVLESLIDREPVDRREFIEDDNRGAILPDPIATLDGMPFYLSVKGIGAAVSPYSWRALDRVHGAELARDATVRERFSRPGPEGVERLITGELWLRGSPYGGQGLEHAETALRISERADLTTIHGFRIAPVVRIAFLPPDLEERLRSIYWYRQYRGRIVQELRLVPSNVRIYFHARHTIGNQVQHVFDLFRIDSNERALAFEVRFVRSTMAMLTLFARTLDPSGTEGRYRGLDFHDVWLDKDAVVAPDGTVFFVDLEGIEPVEVERARVREKIEDQVYRSLYELTFAYEQIEEERIRRFGGRVARQAQFEAILTEALREDPFLRLVESGGRLEFEIRNNCQEGSLYTRFQAVDR